MLTILLEALKLAVEAKIKKELVYAKPGDKTQFSILKNLKRNIPSLLPTSRKIIRALPSREKDASKTDANKTRSTKFDTAQKSLRLGDLSPVNSKNGEKVYPQSTKAMVRKSANNMFVTSAFNAEDRPGTSLNLSRNDTHKSLLKTLNHTKPATL